MNENSVTCPACGATLPDKDNKHTSMNDPKAQCLKLHCAVKNVTCLITRPENIDSGDYYCLNCGRKTLVTNASNTLFYCVDCMRFFSMLVERDEK